MDYLLIGICSVIIIFLFLSYRAYYGKKNANKLAGRMIKTLDEHSNIICPVCSIHLEKGENIISKIYRPMNVPDQYMTISGCPHCYPVCEKGLKRICPVCHKVMNSKDVLTARLFNKSQGKKHVHIAGCSNCHKTKFE